jgi:hypothetical protein
LNDAVGGHEIRQFCDGQDYDIKSLREMNVFDMLKSEKLRPYFNLVNRLDNVDTDDIKDGDLFPTAKEIAAEIPDHDDQLREMDEEVRMYI